MHNASRHRDSGFTRTTTLFMRRTATVALAACFATFGSLMVPPSSAQAIAHSNSLGNLGATIASIAVREVNNPQSCQTYTGLTGISTAVCAPDQGWCATFAYYVWKQAGVSGLTASAAGMT